MTIKTFLRHPAAALAAASLAALPACSSDEPAQEETGEPSEDTLAAAIADAEGLSVVSSALGNSGLAQVFDGAGSYTIFAPNDAAFSALGEAGTELRDPAQTAVMAAVLRGHIVPGYLTPQDIEAALDAQGGRVTVETMGDAALTFTRTDDGIRVRSADGSEAMIAGDALMARNGVAIPLDGVLKKVASPEA